MPPIHVAKVAAANIETNVQVNLRRDKRKGVDIKILDVSDAISHLSNDILRRK